jgi:hypothetical protein
MNVGFERIFFDLTLISSTIYLGYNFEDPRNKGEIVSLVREGSLDKMVGLLVHAAADIQADK